MKIVVAYKWASNPQDAEVRPDGTVDLSRAKAAVSEYDLVAFELARRLVDDAGGEVVGLTVGPASIDTPLARKAALSRGLDRLVMVADDALAGADGTRIAAVLAAAVRTIGEVDLVLAGDSSVDVAEGQVALTLAGQLGWVGMSGVCAVIARRRRRGGRAGPAGGRRDARRERPGRARDDQRRRGAAGRRDEGHPRRREEADGPARARATSRSPSRARPWSRSPPPGRPAAIARD